MLKFGGTQGLLSQREYDELMHRGMELLTLLWKSRKFRVTGAFKCQVVAWSSGSQTDLDSSHSCASHFLLALARLLNLPLSL